MDALKKWASRAGGNADISDLQDELRMEHDAQLPVGCGYSGSDFGASYPDSICVDGQLYDADKCDEKGNLYEPGQYIPCPECQHEAWLEDQRERIEEEGWLAAEDGKPRESCPFPVAATRFPQDGEWYQTHWLKGYDSHEKSE